MRRTMIPFNDYPLDRADAIRKDVAEIRRFWEQPDQPVLVFWRGRPLVDTSGVTVALATLTATELEGHTWVRLFLGKDAGGAPVLAAGLDPAVPALTPPRGRFEDLRPIAGRLSLDDAAVVGAARSVFAWHRTHRFCANCGGATEVESAGWKRRCPVCEREHFPRVDPVVIVLITHTDRVLLGRGPTWPAGFFSCLAGFVEPGETLGEATRREAFEEAKVRLGDVRYLVSQPWPFPSSLMLGVTAEALDDRFEVDGVELAEARWFTRHDVVEMMAGRHRDAAPPGSIAVAHHLLRHWLAG